jgi:DNA-binding Xre family transcriptional regulator
MLMMQSKVKALAMAQGLNNPQQFAIKAALPWATARNIWTGNLAFRHLQTLHKAAITLDCQIQDLYEVGTNDQL